VRVLIADDDRDVAGFLKDGLTQAGFVIDLAQDGEAALEQARQVPYDAILLDVQMPRRDGFSVLRTLRAERNPAAILMTTCRGSENDRVAGLDAGADDYVVKPLLMQELASRLRAVLRRTRPAPARSQPILAVGDLRMDAAAHRVTYKGQPLDLAPKEFSVLEYLMRFAGQAVTKAVLAQAVWGIDYQTDFNMLDVCMNRLREKINAGKDCLLQTVHGVGYRLEIDSKIGSSR